MERWVATFTSSSSELYVGSTRDNCWVLTSQYMSIHLLLVSDIIVHAMRRMRIRFCENKVVCVLCLCGVDTPLCVHTHLVEAFCFIHLLIVDVILLRFAAVIGRVLLFLMQTITKQDLQVESLLWCLISTKYVAAHKSPRQIESKHTDWKQDR